MMISCITERSHLNFKDLRMLIDLTWDLSNGVIAAALDEEIVAAMAESGCIGLFIGMESGNKKNLRSIKNPVQ